MNNIDKLHGASYLDMLLSGVHYSSYDISKYPFRSWFEEMFQHRHLEEIHQYNPVTPSRFVAEVAKMRKKCEERIGEIGQIIDGFFYTIVEPTFGPVEVRQLTPTARVHIAITDRVLDRERKSLLGNQPADFLRENYFDIFRPGAFHRDKDYGLHARALNLWIPVTNVSGSNSLWIGGRERGGRDALPVSMRYGECLIFDGGRRWHGVVWNTSAFTRVSFDIRFVPRYETLASRSLRI